jgi:hypothetical protein
MNMSDYEGEIAMKGIIIGMLLSIPLWALIIGVGYWIFH